MKNKIIYLLLYLVLFSGCENEGSKSANNTESNKYNNLNVTILLDLSDRISVRKNPDQPDKDIAVILTVLDNFKKFLSKKGVVNSEDKIKVIYYPIINYEKYRRVSDSLNIDFGKLDFPDRRKMYTKISDLYLRNLKELYSLASSAKSYEGSDLFNYFKHRVVDDCIINDSNYINILVILTDGYIYHKNCKFKIKNRYSYLIPEAEHVKCFRNIPNWKEVFEKNDYGLIKINNDLSKLNILIAEVNPIYHSPIDYDIIKLYLSKWLEEQNMKKDNYKILKTDMASINKNIINNFFEIITSR